MSSTGPSGARSSGVIRRTVTEQEIAAATKAGAGWGQYTICRKAGATHTEVLEALGAGAGLIRYSLCREVGATHPEAMALRLRGAGPTAIEEPKLAVPALRAACGSTPTREIGETIATLAQDWACPPTIKVRCTEARSQPQSE